MRQADELRRQAAEIRHAAQHAERRKDAERELALAANLDAEADRLEGKVRPAAPPVQTISQEERDKARRARVDEAFAKLERRLGPKQ